MKEITISWVSSFCMIMLPSILFGNSIDTINPIIISKADFGQIDIIPHSVYWVDKTNELPIESLDFSKFKQVDGDKIKARPRETYYIGFEIENELADSNEVNIYIRNPIYSEFFKLQKGKLFPLGKLGRAVLNSDKIKFQLEPKSKTKYLVSYVAWADHSNIRLEARSSDSQRNYLQNIKTSKRVKKAFERFFWIVLFVMGILAFTFYYFIEIEAFKWYGFYLFSTLFMFSKGFPEIFMGNSYLYKLFYLFEPLFSLGMTLFYILFAQSFLNLRKITPTVNKVVTLISFFLIGLVFIDLLLRMTVGHLATFIPFVYTRILLFPIFISFTIFLIFYSKEVLFRYILIGTSIFLLPLLVTLLKHNFRYHSENWTVFGSWTVFENISIWCYSSKVGILLETICFFMGLAYLTKKTETEKREYKNIAAENQLKLKEIETNKIQADIPKIKSHSKISLPSREGYDLIDTRQILYCAADGNMCCIFFKNGKRKLISKTLKEVVALLPESEFIRIHNSHTVNIDSVVRYIRGEGGVVILTSGEELKVSRSRKEFLLEKLNIS